MNKLKYTTFLSFAVALFIFSTMFVFNGCTTTEDITNPCDEITCLNGGEKIMRSNTSCECTCSGGFSGDQCQIEPADCTVVECPEGKEPNPAKDCLCE